LADTVAHGHNDNRLLATMSPDTLALMGRDLRQISLAQGAAIYEPGDPLDQIYFPQTGMISLLVVTKKGGSIETATVGREGAVGLQRGLGTRRSFTRATAQIAGRFSVIRAAQFAPIVREDAALRDLIARYTEVLWAEAQQIAACNATHDSASRLCRWLLQSADRIGSDKVNLTQEFLAQMLGVRRTTVTLLAQSIQKKGIIKYSRGHIAILDRPGLEARACECYQIMRFDKLPHKIGVKF
jgi:CRP-like cAMP-binding protein